MIIERKKIADLNLADYNPRKDLQPGDSEFEKLKRSIEEFGYVEPVIWNERTGNVVGGHQRLKVLRDLGNTEIDCVIVDIDLPKEKALNIALNKISGAWDDELLSALLKDIADSGFDATLTGFDTADLTAMFDDETDIVEDEIPEVIEEDEGEPFSRFGDVFTLGKHTLMVGDSTDKEQTVALVGDSTVDMYLTDPPYNVNYEGSDGKTIQNDNMSDVAFEEFLSSAFSCACEVLKKGGSYYIWHAESPDGVFRRTVNANLGKVRQLLVWNKNSFVMGRSDYQNKYEPCLYGWKEGASHYFLDDRTQSTVFEDKKIDINKMKKEDMKQLLKDIYSDKISFDVINEDKPARNGDHPTMKPLKLLARLIKNSTQIGEVVLDNFSGSGSTLITCEQLGRVCKAMELDPKYADVIVKRWLKFTRKDSVELLRNGEKIVVKSEDIL
ncbi:MAG: site-specific DNA-methyltransferase [Bacillota bacterium]